MTGMLREVMRLVGMVLSLAFGSSGVFMLWASFYVPNCGLLAVLFLSAAVALTLTSP